MLYHSLALASFISQVYSFVILSSKVLVSTRLDPVVQPGVASSHLHNIVGGNRFNATYDPQYLLSSTCTTSPITVDRSNYWAPAMYFLNKTTTPLTFTRVQSGFNIYYLPRGNKGDIKAFPPGFKMIAGDNGRNTYNASLFSDQAISWVCLDYENSSVNGRETPGFPTTNCPNGIRGQVFFPSCWDGVNLDSANHKDHVSYPIQNYNGGECPSSHPVKLVSLFYEQIFDTGGFEMNSDGQTWVLANGDTTGYSMHADFQNGWDTSILQKVIDQCDEDSGNGNIRACQPLVPFIDEGARDACQLDSDIQIPDEHIGLFRGGALSTLLGNNPIWLPSLPKPSNLTYVESASWGRVGSLLEGVGTRGSHPPSFGTTDGTQIGDVNGADWEVRGCIGESKNGRRALEGSVITDQPEMNLRTCALLCESRGYSIAGVEFGHECYCDNALRNGVQLDLLPNVTCGMPCPGNPYENCGGSSTITLLVKEGVVIRTTGQSSNAQLYPTPPLFVVFLYIFMITNVLMDLWA